MRPNMRPKLNIFVFSDLVQIKRGRKSIELMPLDEADELGRELRLAVAAARAARAVTVQWLAPAAVHAPRLVKGQLTEVDAGEAGHSQECAEVGARGG